MDKLLMFWNLINISINVNFFEIKRTLTCRIGLGDFNNSTNLWFILNANTLLILFDIFSINNIQMVEY